MKKINLKKSVKKMLSRYRNYDIKLIKLLYMYFYKNRYRVYVVVFLFFLPIILLKIPYLNIRLIGTLEETRFIFYFILIMLFAGWREKRLFMISAIGFPVLCALVLLGKTTLAEQLANTVFLLLSTATIIAISKQRNEIK